MSAAETCLYTNTPDERFVLERRGRIVVAAACNGQGFQLAPESGRRVAALALDAGRGGRPMSATAQRLDECLSIRDGELFVEECRRRSWRGGSARRSTSSPRTSFAATLVASGPSSRTRWPGRLLLLPSMKANPRSRCGASSTGRGVGCDVFGPGELEAALRTGTDPALISLNGPMKGDALLERAIREGVRITLDSRAELSRAAGDRRPAR